MLTTNTMYVKVRTKQSVRKAPGTSISSLQSSSLNTVLKLLRIKVAPADLHRYWEKLPVAHLSAQNRVKPAQRVDTKNRFIYLMNTINFSSRNLRNSPKDTTRNVEVWTLW